MLRQPEEAIDHFGRLHEAVLDPRDVLEHRASRVGVAEVHVHLAYAHPAIAVLEYIPWIKDCFTDPAEVLDGWFKLPQEPGAGTTPTPAALQQFGKAVD